MFCQKVIRITFLIVTSSCFTSYMSIYPQPDYSLDKITVILNEITNNTNIDLIIKDNENKIVVPISSKLQAPKKLGIPIELKKIADEIIEYKLPFEYLAIYNKNNMKTPIGYLTFNARLQQKSITDYFTFQSVLLPPELTINYELFNLVNLKKQIFVTAQEKIDISKLPVKSLKLKTNINFEPDLKNSKIQVIIEGGHRKK